MASAGLPLWVLLGLVMSCTAVGTQLVTLAIMNCDSRMDWLRYRLACSPEPGSGDTCEARPANHPVPLIRPEGCDIEEYGAAGEVRVHVGSSMWFGIVRPPLDEELTGPWTANRCFLNITASPGDTDLVWWLIPGGGPYEALNRAPLAGKVELSCDYGNPFIEAS